MYFTISASYSAELFFRFSRKPWQNHLPAPTIKLPTSKLCDIPAYYFINSRITKGMENMTDISVVFIPGTHNMMKLEVSLLCLSGMLINSTNQTFKEGSAHIIHEVTCKTNELVVT